VNKPGPIESFLPVMLLAIGFGLSMDDRVFLVTRNESSGSPQVTGWRCNGFAATGKTI
jgi:hypothetical protein